MRSEKVNFYSEGNKLGGVLYLPDSDQGKPFPGIVQGPGFLGLKDAKHYIMMFEKLCAVGYACLCFDYRGWGDSEGEPRGWGGPTGEGGRGPGGGGQRGRTARLGDAEVAGGRHQECP